MMGMYDEGEFIREEDWDVSWDNEKLTTGETPLKKHRIKGYDGSVFEYYIDPKNKGFSEWLDRLNEYSTYLEPVENGRKGS
jgi:hypothetical protein